MLISLLKIHSMGFLLVPLIFLIKGTAEGLGFFSGLGIMWLNLFFYSWAENHKMINYLKFLTLLKYPFWLFLIFYLLNQLMIDEVYFLGGMFYFILALMIWVIQHLKISFFRY